MGASDLQVALIVAAPFIGLSFSTYWSHLTQNRRSLPFTVWPNAVARLSLMALAAITVPWAYVLLVIWYSLISAVPGAPYAALMQKIYPAEARGRLLGAIRLLVGAAQIPAIFLAGKLLDRFGASAPYVIGPVMGVLSVVYFARIKEPPLPASPAPRRSFSWREQARALLANRPFAMTQLGFMLFGFGNLMMAPLYPIFQVDHLGLNNSQVAQVSMLWSAAWLLGFPIWGKMADRTKPLYVIASGAILYVMAPLLYYFGRSLLGASLAAVLQGFGDAAIELGWMAYVLSMGSGKAGIYAGLHLSLLGLRGALAPLAASGLIAPFGIAPVFLLGSAIVAAGLIPLAVASRMPGPAARSGETAPSAAQ
jgi:Na+/melibiose symporter-like transporter